MKRKLTTDEIVELVWAGNSNPTWDGPKPPPRPPAGDAEISRLKRCVEILMDEYEQALIAYRDFLWGWRARQRAKGFRRAKIEADKRAGG